MGMRITQLTVENVKRLVVVEINPDGSTVLIGGENDQGKSSLLDSIAYALGGKALIPDEPIRKGQDEAIITIKLGGDSERQQGPLIVTRKFKRRDNGTIKTTLEVRTDDEENGSYKAGTPQQILDDLCSMIAFDPLAFTRQKPKEQRETLRTLVGLDFTDLDEEIKKAYAERTDKNRDIKRVKAVLADQQTYDDVPDDEVVVAELLADLTGRESRNKSRRNVRDSLTEMESSVQTLDASVAEAKRLHAKAEEDAETIITEAQSAADTLVSEATDHLDAMKINVLAAHKNIDAAIQSVAELPADEDEQEIRTQIEEADAVNAKVRANAKCLRDEAELAKIDDDAKRLTGIIAAAEAKKQKMMDEANWPLPGMGFSENGVTCIRKGLTCRTAYDRIVFAYQNRLGNVRSRFLRVGLVDV